MFVAGIDAHATYSVIAIVSNAGQLVHGPVRIKNADADRLSDLLEPYRPLEVVVETSPAWPWLFDRLDGDGVHFVLAHAKRIRVIAESNYKSDEIDAGLTRRSELRRRQPRGCGDHGYPAPGHARPGRSPCNRETRVFGSGCLGPCA